MKTKIEVKYLSLTSWTLRVVCPSLIFLIVLYTWSTILVAVLPVPLSFKLSLHISISLIASFTSSFSTVLTILSLARAVARRRMARRVRAEVKVLLRELFSALSCLKQCTGYKIQNLMKIFIKSLVNFPL